MHQVSWVRFSLERRKLRDNRGWGRNLGRHSLLMVDICFGIFFFFKIQVIGLMLEGSFLSFFDGVWLCRKDQKLGERQAKIKVNPRQ